MLRLRRRTDGVVVPDVAGRRPGRSAWLCPRRQCLETAVRRRAIGRALAGPAGLTVREPMVDALWSALADDTTARLELLRRTAPVGAEQISALARLQHSLQGAGEVA